MDNKEFKLEKKLSPLNVWALAFGCIVGSGSFLMPGTTFLPSAGPLGTAIAFVIASAIMIIIAINYHFMISHHPIAGGEFTYAHEAFGRNHAFICAWFLGLGYLAIVPVNATGLAMIGRSLLGDIFQVGFHYNIAGYDVYLGEVCLAVAAVLLFAWLSIRGVKFAGVFQSIIVIALIAGILIVAIAAIASPEVTWHNLSPGYSPGNTPLSGILAILAVAPFSFVGFDTVPQAAEEFRFSHQKTKLVMVISILFGGMIYIILNTIAASVVPDGYSTWVEYIEDLGNLSGITSIPTFHAAYKLLGNFGLFAFGVAVLGAILSGIIGFYMATSRLLYSIARENLLPTWFRAIHAKYKTPVNAIVFIMIISLIIPFFGRTAFGWVVDMSAIGTAIGYGYTSAATVKYAIKEKNKVVTVTGIIGFAISLFFAVLLLVPIPAFNCSFGKESYICFIIWTLLGAVFYTITKRKNFK